jgi:diacylglycerol kinase (ATP)
MKALLIGNPVAGKGAAKTKADKLGQILQRKGIRLETYFTESRGDAKKQASCIDPEVSRIVVAGGDGTLNEVINGLPDPSRVPIVLLPTGTSNVMAHEIGLTNELESIAHLMQYGEISRTDMGTIGEHRFLLFASAGIDANIQREVLNHGKARSGYRRYMIPVLKTLARYQPPHFRVSVDGNGDLQGGMVFVGNTRFYGGVFTITDQARCDSGHFDICVVPNGGIPSLARFYLAAACGRVSRTKNIHYHIGMQIQIKSDKPAAVQVDGDYFGTTPVLINIHPSVVPLVVSLR